MNQTQYRRAVFLRAQGRGPFVFFTNNFEKVVTIINGMII